MSEDLAGLGNVSGGLAQKLAQIAGVLKAVPKNGRHPQGYDYATAEDITTAVRHELTKARIAIVPRCLSTNVTAVSGVDKFGKPKTNFVTDINMEYLIVDGDMTKD